MSNTRDLVIANTSVHFKKVARAIAKNEGRSLGRLFIKFAYEEIKKYDFDQYENPDIKTSREDFLVKAFPETLRLQIDRVARNYGLSYNEFSKHLIISMVNSYPKDMKVFKLSEED